MKLCWKTCAKIAVTAFALYLCVHYWPAFMGVIGSLIGAASPLIIGAALAYLVNILMSGYEKIYFPRSSKKAVLASRRPVCVIVAFITLISIIALIIGLVLPQFVACINLLISKIPDAMSSFIDFLEKFEILPEDIISTLEKIDWKSRIGQIMDVLTSGIGDVMDVVVNTVTSVFSAIVTALLSTIFAVYLLMGKDTIGKQISRVMKIYLKKEVYGKIVYVRDILNDCFKKYIIGQCTEAVILGVLCAIGMWILKLPYAAMIGALIAFTALIPVAGAYIGAAVGAFMILTVSPAKALIFLIFLVVLQQLEGNIIYPRVVGSSMGLPGIWVLAAVTVGGGTMGVAGMLIGVPVAAALYRLLKNDVSRREKCGLTANASLDAEEKECVSSEKAEANKDDHAAAEAEAAEHEPQKNEKTKKLLSFFKKRKTSKEEEQQ